MHGVARTEYNDQVGLRDTCRFSQSDHDIGHTIDNSD